MSKSFFTVTAKKVYKNSACEVCKSIYNPLKLKKHPLTNDDIIICRECFSELYLKNKGNVK